MKILPLTVFQLIPNLGTVINLFPDQWKDFCTQAEADNLLVIVRVQVPDAKVLDVTGQSPAEQGGMFVFYDRITRIWQVQGTVTTATGPNGSLETRTVTEICGRLIDRNAQGSEAPQDRGPFPEKAVHLEFATVDIAQVFWGAPKPGDPVVVR